jgi:hypothetical protein
MATVTVSSIVLPNWNYGGSTAKLRLFLQTGFVSSAGIPLQASAPNSGQFYKDVTITITGTDASVASFTLDSTTDGLDIQSARYSAFFYNSSGQRLKSYEGFDNFAVGPSPTTVSWADIRTFNFALQPNRDFSAYTKAQSDARYATIGTVGVADPGSNGLMARSGLNSSIARTITGTANQIAVANGDGSGNPTLALVPLVVTERLSAVPATVTYDQASNALGYGFGFGSAVPGTPVTIDVATSKILTPFITSVKNSGAGKLLGFYFNLEASGATQDSETVRGLYGRVTNSGTGNEKTSAVRVGATGSGSNASHLLGVDADITIIAGTQNISSVYAATVFGTTDDVSSGLLINSNDGGRLLLGVGTIVSPVPIRSAFYRAWMATASHASARGFQQLNNAAAEVFYTTLSGDIVTGTNPAASGALRLANNASISGRNAANNADVSLLKLNAANEIEVSGALINQVANAFFQVGSSASGWLFQNVDSDGRWRLFKQGVGEALAVYPALYTFIANTTGAPAGTPSGGGYLYVESGALKYKGSSGTVTGLAPA